MPRLQEASVLPLITLLSMRSTERLPVAESADGPDMEMINELRRAIARLARAQRAERQRDMRALPLSLLSVLSILERIGPMTASQIAALEGVRKPSITRALADLEAQGLVKRGVLPTDARRMVIQITPRGIKSVKESRGILNEWYAERLSQLGAEDVAAIKRAVGALSRLADHAVLPVTNSWGSTNHPDRATPTHQPWRDAQSVSKEGSQAAAPS
jgi:DNA-binding MarR family transcriptional regulator